MEDKILEVLQEEYKDLYWAMEAGRVTEKLKDIAGKISNRLEQRVIKSEAFVPSNATVAELTDKINNVRQFLGKTFALSNDYADEKNLKILEAEKRLKKIVDELSNRSL